MKLKLFVPVLSLILMAIFATPAFAQGPDGAELVFGDNLTVEDGTTMDRDVVVFGGNVTIKESSKVDGDMVVFGGNVTVDSTSRIDGDVAALGGNVTIEGTVDGDLAAIGGNVKVAEGATIKGDVGLLGGNPIINGVVEGKVQNLTRFGVDYDHSDQTGNEDFFEMPEPPVPPSPPEAPNFEFDGEGFGAFSWIGRIISDIFWTIALLIVLSLVTWLVAAFMPEQMLTVRRTIAESWPVSFGMGLITAIVVTLVGAVLLITICLAFVPMIAWTVLFVATLFGWIVIGQMFGERLLIASGNSNPSFIFSSIVGVVILTILTNMPVVGQIPCIGFIFGFVGFVIGLALSVTGMGAVLLTRFGTRPYPSGVSDYGFSGGPTPPPRSSAAGPVGVQARWTEPAPDVSDEELPSSDDDLKARIKAALAEADADKPEPTEPADKPEDEVKPLDED